MNLQDMTGALALIKQELAPLAEKIGEGAEYTFGLFVRQVYVNAFTSLLWIPVGILLAWWARKLSQTKWDNASDDGFRIVGVILLVVLALFAILIPIGVFIQALVNPEYQAIKLIIETITPAQQ